MKSMDQLNKEIVRQLRSVQYASSLRAIEAESGCSRSTLSRILNGQIKPTDCRFEVVINLCQAIFIDLESIDDINDGK